MEEPHKTILFIDEVCPKPYSPGILSGCGGTEITVCAMAEALADKGYKVIVEQHNREEHTHGGIRTTYAKLGSWAQADYVICLRKPESLLSARERFPTAKLYLWAHDLYDQQMALRTLAAIEATNPLFLLCVSEFHRIQIRSAMTGFPSDASTKLRTVYPPISDDLQPDNTPVDMNKLCFISSPHKGLEHALNLFKHLRRREGSLTLHITNPGYFEGKPVNQEGVVVHGSLDHSQVISLLRSSLCLFFPNTVFPETFGRVFAEAEAVGTPVLTHNLGAAPEVISDGRELANCTSPEEVIERILEWRGGRRPTVRAKKSFRLQRVVNRWMREILI